MDNNRAVAIYTIICFFICFCQITGQTLKGYVHVNKKPMNAAEVFIVDSEQKKYFTITGENGQFSIELPNKKWYSVKIFSNKKLLLDRNIFLEGNKIENFSLEEKEVEIKGLDIISKKKIIQQKVDRLVFNVENSIIAGSGDVLDAILLAPRISVQNDEIKIMGKNKILVMLDNRPINIQKNDLINYLKSIRSDDISSIEVITNPPSKYIAEGNSGIVNIITKKSKTDYWNLTLNTSGQISSRFINKDGIIYNLKHKDLSISSSVNYAGGYSVPTKFSNIEYPDATWTENNNQLLLTDNFSSRISIDYKINKHISTGAQYIGSYSSPVIESNIESNIFGKSNNNSLIQTKSKDSKNNKFTSFNYHIIYAIDTIGKKISFDFDYFNNIGNTSQVYATNIINDLGSLSNSQSFSSGKNEGAQRINNYSMNVDVEHPTSWIDFNYGARLSFTNTLNDIKFYNLNEQGINLDKNKTNQFSFKEKNQAIYFSANKKIGDKWEAQVGIRLENIQTNGFSKTLNQESDIRYTKFFPTAYILYKLNDHNQFSVNYGKRIHRPEFSLLNPFKYIYSPYSTSEGNPYLLPEFTNNLEFTYNYKDFMITSLYYSDLKDGFDMLNMLDNQSKIQNVRPINFITNKSYGINQYFYLKLFSWLNVNLTLNIFNSQSKSNTPITLSYLNGWNLETKADLNFTLNKQKTFFLGVNLWQTSKGVSNLDRNSSGYQVDASLKLLLNKKLQLICYANDIFRSNIIAYTGFSNNNETFYRNYDDLRFVRLSLVYSFGNKSIKESSREVKNSEEKERAVSK
ncbi:TonB-dependent receptor [Elizabethkingia argentiflava]|uniref:TonB-dependent receptor n=1 Tax=Elizabethkingia argenteiflava TaxID=2681556 RepID=A0A845PX65_9FLAO|nr:outer membrane beta-barrel family protein [Elizabethkingia argenteiflava]NAW51813.1 TonB-dependent receptor [Elizabethkingia argenteiflava]